MLSFFIDMTERGMVPNSLIRVGVRRLCEQRLSSLSGVEFKDPQAVSAYVEMLKKSPVAVATKDANEQHYEVPAEFFLLCLGPHLKYSCGYWPVGEATLEDSERISLEATMERAEIRDGMKILEIGCGWGSLTLAMAEKFKNSQITAVSNSNSQREFIMAKARERNLTNIEVLTHDMSVTEDLGPGRDGFDRVISVEMFEHLRNYEIILARIRKWLAPDGKLFIHIFTHRNFPYLYETEGDHNWMGRYFFTGGQMPSHDLLKSFQNDLMIEKEWRWSGVHYQKTSEAWLANLEKNKQEILELFAKVYGKSEAVRWYNRWRIFFVAVAEFFGFKNGSEWGVSHYLFRKP